MFNKILFAFCLCFCVHGLHGVVEDTGEPLFLTPYIEDNKTSEAKRLSLVQHLPNAQNIESYSGFLTIDKRFNSHMFFWFFPSFKNPQKAPLIVYLEGGPGASSIRSMFYLNGPFIVESNLTVTQRPDTWVQEFSLLYIDNPLGTGFSDTADDRGYSNEENSVSDNLYEFLQQFYTIFSEYKGNDMYFSGQSYAGKYIPAIGYKLMEKRNEIDFNFKGITIGNGLSDPLHQLHYSQLMHDIGLLDRRLEREMRAIQDECESDVKRKDNVKASDCFSRLYMIGYPNSSIAQMTGYKSIANILESGSGAYVDLIVEYLNLTTTREAIHVGRQPFHVFTLNCTVLNHLRHDFSVSVMANMTALIDNGYKVLLYVGNLDMIVGVVQMNGMLENPDWKYYSSLDSSERVVWRVDPNDAEVAGYVKSFGNFTYAIVRNAGHEVPHFQYRSWLDMMKRFILGQTFEN